jgi:hypothetical protein
LFAFFLHWAAENNCCTASNSVADPWHFGSGSGTTDQCHLLMDPDADPDPSVFIIDLQDANKKQIFLKKIFAYFF